jgi:hypothetical protein
VRVGTAANGDALFSWLGGLITMALATPPKPSAANFHTEAIIDRLIHYFQRLLN